MGWIYTQFSVANDTAGGELQLPYRIRVGWVILRQISWKRELF